MRSVRSILNEYNIEISLVLSIGGIIFALGTSPEAVRALHYTLSAMLLINIYLLVVVYQLKKKIKRLDNKADSMTLEVINRFRFRKPINEHLSLQIIHNIVRIKKFDIELEYEFKGICDSKEGVDSFFSEIYADSNLLFNELDYQFIDLINAPNERKPGNLLNEDRKLFLIQSRFVKRLNYGNPFHVKYFCKLRNSANYGDDYFTTKIQRNSKNVSSFVFTLEFYDEMPELVEVFDATHGGASTFLEQLAPEPNGNGFVYNHKLNEISTSMDLAYKFKRKISETKS